MNESVQSLLPDKKILIIENRTSSFCISDILLFNNCTLYRVNSINEALDAVPLFQPDIIINVTDRIIREMELVNLNKTISEINVPIVSMKISNPGICAGVSSDSKDVEAEKLLQRELVKALEQNEFLLYYQPIVSLDNMQIAGFEALMRWYHPEKKLVYPDEFIYIAEKSNLIVDIGLWVINEASRQLKILQEMFPREKPLTMSINLSARQFIFPNLVEEIQRAVDRHQVRPDTLRLELTESVIMEDIDSANMLLLKLKSNNFIIYMDDFGTGYSSLSYLKHFPVDFLKVDQSFVRWMEIDSDSFEIVRAIITLAHNLGMKVIAEGIETGAHINKLIALGCEYGQGYYFSKPVDARGAMALLQGTICW